MLGKVLSEMPKLKPEIPNLLKAIRQTIKVVNKMSAKEREKKLKEI